MSSVLRHRGMFYIFLRVSRKFPPQETVCVTVDLCRCCVVVVMNSE